MDHLTEFIHDCQFSRLIEEYPDKKFFPKYYEAKKFEVILEKGDALFIPAGWFHWVFSETTENNLNIAINFWYKTEWDLDYVSYKNHFKIHYSPEFDYMKHLSDIHVPLLCSFSDTNFIPEQRVRKHFPSVHCMDSLITLQEFFEHDTGSNKYIVIPDPKLAKYGPPWCSGLELAPRGSKWWINKGNVTTGLHCDQYDNYLCQISGRKRILLFPPSEYDKLYLINHYPQSFINEIRKKFLDKK